MNSVTLEGKKGLVAGIANANSIAYGCAKVFRSLGAELAITYRGAKSEPYVRPLAGELASPIIMPCDVREPGQLEAVFERVRREWGRLDFLLHSIEFASKEDMHSRVVDCSQAGFALAMDVSCHSFHPDGQASRAPHDGGRLPVDLDLLRVREGGRALLPDGAGESGPGERRPLHGRRTRPEGDQGPRPLARPGQDPGGLGDRLFRRDPGTDAARAPIHHLVGLEDVGAVAAFLVGDWAKSLTGSTTYVDAGYHIIG